jgi:tetratricopeptide (TPR) repeat protein
MKNVISLLLCFLIIGAGLHAQDDPKKMLRKADRSYAKYNLDQKNNKGELMEAKNLIDQVVKTSEYKNDAEAWVVKGQIYDALAMEDMKAAITNPNAAPKNPDAPFTAYDAYDKALKVAEKNRYENDALDGLRSVAQSFNAIGNGYLQTQAYANAYRPLNNLLNIHATLTRNDEDPIFQSENDLNQQKYVVAVCAMQAGDMDRGQELLEELYNKEYMESAVYSNLFDLYMKQGDEEKANKVLAKGKELFPEDTQLLFAEINYYIQSQQYDKLEEKLKQAIEKEPNNPSVRSALGNVYMKIYNDSLDAGNFEGAERFKEKALDYFHQTIEIDSSSFEAFYSIGSIYFNEAAALTQKMGELGMSKEDQKKYNEYKEETEKLFDEALPYFKKAEKLNPNDQSTLIALREIFARMNDFEKSKQFKERLDRVKAGETIEESYFMSHGAEE